MKARAFAFPMLALAIGSLSACNTKRWDEEVKLNDGRTIVVHQKRRMEGPIERESWLTAKLPEFGAGDIVWHDF